MISNLIIIYIFVDNYLESLQLTSLSDRTPFLDYFINQTFAQNYPPEKWHIRVYNRVWEHADHVQELINYHVTNNPASKLASVKIYQPKVSEEGSGRFM